MMRWWGVQKGRELTMAIVASPVVNRFWIPACAGMTGRVAAFRAGSKPASTDVPKGRTEGVDEMLPGCSGGGFRVALPALLPAGDVGSPNRPDAVRPKEGLCRGVAT
jgi:hypothetical protein